MKKKRLTDEGKFKLFMLVFAGLFVYTLIAEEYVHSITCVLAVWLTYKYYNLAIAWHKAYTNEHDAGKRTITLQKELIEALEYRLTKAKRKKPSYGIAKPQQGNEKQIQGRAERCQKSNTNKE